MKTAKEFIQKLNSDEAFARQVNEAIQAKRDAGAKDYTEALIPVAAELGYEIKPEQVEALRAKQAETLSEEELGKAAGGTSCLGVALWATAAAAVSAGTASAVVTAITSTSC